MGSRGVGYRADIQLLRAVAVVLVVGYHLGIAGLRNGFLGVDIFFVISGYLMQTLYRAEEGPLAFYRRRAARLLPAYFVCVVATPLAACLLSLPDAVDQVSDQAVAAALFSSNFLYWAQDSYFTPNLFNPLLHLWSLGVEFQFYLIVPLLVLQPGKRWPLASLIVGSLVACLVVTSISPKTSFFLLPFRLWEFGIGMAVARWRKGHAAIGGLGFVVSLGLIGVALLLPVSGTLPNAIFGHPGGGAMLAVTGTALALASQIDNSRLSGKAAASAIWLGDISYSLYLVHYPILLFAFAQPFHGSILGDGSAKAVALLVPIVLLAVAMHYAIERSGQRWVNWRRIAVVSALVLASSPLASKVSLNRFDLYERHLFSSRKDRAVYRCGKLFRVMHSGQAFCPLASGERGTVLLVGDSHADAIKMAVADAASARGMGVQLSVSNEPLLTSSLGPRWLADEARRRGARVVLLHYHSGHLTAPLVAAAAHSLADEGIELAVMMPVPELDQPGPQLLFEAHRAGRPAPSIDAADYRRRTDAVRRELQTMAGVELLEPADVLCRSTCPLAQPTGNVFYFDANHLTLTGARRLEPLLGQWLDRVLARPLPQPAEATREQS